MKTLQGVAVSDGITIGPAIVMHHREFDIAQISTQSADAEMSRVNQAKAKVEENLQKQLTELGDDPNAQILQAHLTMLHDPELASGIESGIQNGWTAEYAVSSSLLTFAETLEALPDEYLRERAQDLRDLRMQWLQQLFGQVSTNEVPPGAIICANELLPSQFLQVRSKGVGGIITEQGGTTSHVSILARNFGIPMITGVRLTEVTTGEVIGLNAQSGEVTVNPDAATKQQLETTKEEYEQLLRDAEDNRYLEAATATGKVVEIAANIGGPDDVAGALENGADGIGLFRTEFLFMDRDSAPTEEEQYEVYRQVVTGMQGKRVVIRTLDAGADKKVSYLPFDNEENPFLGVRGLRYTLLHNELFQTQLRAVLRAATHGKIALMFPMVTSVNDVEEALAAVEEARNSLRTQGEPFGELELGAMIEVPAAALITDLLAEKLDFVSVGTNDLIQYTTASDRMNPAVTKWYDASHPGLWRLLKQIADGAHQNGAWVGMCGELAGTLEFIPKLVELGFEELSMSPKRIGLVKTAIRKM